MSFGLLLVNRWQSDGKNGSQHNSPAGTKIPNRLSMKWQLCKFYNLLDPHLVIQLIPTQNRMQGDARTTAH